MERPITTEEWSENRDMRTICPGLCLSESSPITVHNEEDVW